MEREKNLTDEISNYCKKIGIDLVGFADPNDFYRFSKNNQPESYLDKSKTVIIIGIYISDLILDTWFQENKKKSYHFADLILENYCFLLSEFLLNKGYKSVILPYEPGIYLKDSAAIAGLGPIGRNNLLITEKFGSQVRLRALTTSTPLIVGEPILASKYCADCNLCQESCPAGAFPNNKYNKDICLSFNIMNLKKLSKNASIWCNICIESCPVGKNNQK